VSVGRGSRAESPSRRHLLAGLIRCGPCGQLMDAHWVNGRAGYRCRHGHNSARPAPPGRPRNLYVREDTLVAGLARQLMVDRDERVPCASELAARLRQRATAVVHNRTGWSLAAHDDV
jgi:site-specific DNA recombinase